jgi:nickel-type superoxide dismutase maturation protease
MLRRSDTGIIGAVLARLPLTRFVVEGASMEPAYRDGDRLLVNRLAYVLRAPGPGDVVVLRDPQQPGRYLLKRVAQAPEGARGPGRFYVLGDNPRESRDSRSFGAVTRAAIVGKAWIRY